MRNTKKVIQFCKTNESILVKIRGPDNLFLSLKYVPQLFIRKDFIQRIIEQAELN
jgi:hypothetical protein